ncbi:hypothetical protein [Ferviditalea candida]|uniref:Uncharacterized protein n=1 Tax=Ferviditalea candida TaxID=3108399 RepID=A0ABU5ZKV0_9BACL|nr:hypothetical protein [Paenibacillaceae bacterium T2]
MEFQVYPVALGRDQSEAELHIWDPVCGLSQSFEGTALIQCDSHWGAGMIEDEAALILYLFEGEQAIEVYFTENVSVGPNREMNSWDVLLSMQPESLVLVYGESPSDRSAWLKVDSKEPGGLMLGLERFVERVLSMDTASVRDPVLQKLTDYFKQFVTTSCS